MKDWRLLAMSVCVMAATSWSCGPKAAPPADAGASPSTQPMSLAPPEPQPEHKDATPEQQYLMQVITYRITLPAGAVSRNEEFWKHVDEQAVDVATYEMLFKNGMRVGVSPSGEWSYLKDILENNPAVTQLTSYTGRDARDVDLEMKKAVEYQNIFYFDAHGELIGKTHERCDNLIRLSFIPAPRKHGQVRMTVCPVVRSLRERLVPIGDVNTRTIQRVFPEQFFDLNLTVDVPLDAILVIAPSPEVKQKTSVGTAFLIGEAAAQQSETLLILKPIVYRQRIDRSNPAGMEKK